MALRAPPTHGGSRSGSAPARHAPAKGLAAADDGDDEDWVSEEAGVLVILEGMTAEDVLVELGL